jgi:hypothetical protein
MKKTLQGPGIRIELDTDEVIPDDPGAGTPAMVYVTGPVAGQATYWCALDTGEIDTGRHGYRDLTPAQSAWLERQLDAVNDFLGG